MKNTNFKGLPDIKRDTVERQVYQTLREAILNGALSAGHRLVQEDLAAELGASRIPIRSALQILEVDGLVTVDRKGGYYVNTFGAKDVEEIYDLRMLLEPHAAAKALSKLTTSDIKNLKALLDEMEQVAHSQNTESYVSLNRKFHMSIYEASDEFRLVRIIRSLWSGRPLFNPLEISGRFEDSVTEHQAIIRAIDVRDTDALVTTLIIHIKNARDLLRERFKHREES